MAKTMLDNVAEAIAEKAEAIAEKIVPEKETIPDPMEEEVMLVIPKLPNGPDKIWVSVNMVAKEFPCGILVKVPKPYAEVLLQTMSAENIQ